jgi:hypothetical protein
MPQPAAPPLPLGGVSATDLINAAVARAQGQPQPQAQTPPQPQQQQQQARPRRQPDQPDPAVRPSWRNRVVPQSTKPSVRRASPWRVSFDAERITAAI